MAGIGRTRASIRFFGDELDPAEISGLLGAEPTHSGRKGEVAPSGHVLKRGSWRLAVSERAPGDLDGQIKSLFADLTNDLSIWRDLSERYDADVFCGLFMDFFNEGAPISRTVLQLLSERGLRLDVDIYAPSEQNQPLH